MANQKAQPAFPTWINDDAMQAGMELSDFFAAAVIQGMYANPKHQGNMHYTDATEAFEMADAMMRTRNAR
jgi:hypothetical protein